MDIDTGESGGLQTSPIEIDGVLYGITPNAEIFSPQLRPRENSLEFDSGIEGHPVNRGLGLLTDGKKKRILAGVMKFRLRSECPHRQAH